jgi:cell division protein FtsI (penicillin-binding protein 3)
MKNNNKDFLRRVFVLVAVMGLWGTVISARLYFLHVVESADLQNRALRQQQRTLDVSPRRGAIYDRNGNELAISIKVDSVFAVADEVVDPALTAARLSKLTGVAKAELVKKLQSGRSFTWIKRKLSENEATAIREAKLPGIYFQKEDQRFYPKRQLAAHVLGYVNMDEEGMGGLEYRYNDKVRGESGKIVVMTDARGHRFDSVEQPPAAGANLVTTIDENIQFIIEKELQATVKRTRPKGVSIVAMDPQNGEILGMANYPQFNPNDYGKYSPNTWANRAVSQVYEPGSTFKIVTVAAALEERLTRPDEIIDCLNGSIVLYGHRIRDHKPFGLLSVTEVIQKSSDVGVIKLGLRLGDDRFASYINRLGFGRPTNIDLPGEERGLTKPASRWSKVSVGAISMGQEIGVTPLQIVSLVSSVANGGILYQPYVVKRVEHPQSGILDEAEPRGERVMSVATAEKVKGMLEVVVTDGTAKSARLDGYSAAGKTGTAQKIDETGRYSKTKHIASFAGYAPASSPMVSLIVVIDEPQGLYNGGEVAAPVFKTIAEQILRYMSVAPDVPLSSPQTTEGKPKTDRTKEPGNRSVSPPPAVSGGWKVVDAAFSVRPAASEPFAFGEIAVPNFHGKSLRQITEECLRLGLRLRSAGSGAAIEQFPPPGTSVRAGADIQIRFSTRR